VRASTAGKRRMSSEQVRGIDGDQCEIVFFLLLLLLSFFETVRKFVGEGEGKATVASFFFCGDGDLNGDAARGDERKGKDRPTTAKLEEKEEDNKTQQYRRIFLFFGA
jgi:hypothetical protein